MRKVHWQSVTLVALVAVSSGHRFSNDFVFDDVAMIVRGDVIHDFAQLATAWGERTMFVSAADDGSVDSIDTYRPLSVTTFFVDAAWSGRDPFGYHLTNLLLHLGCVLLLHALIRRLLARARATADDTAAFFATAVFAVHPWLAEAHVWINGRSDPLALVFVLATAHALLGPRRWLALPCFFAALLSKETALLVLPALVLLPTAESGWPSRRHLGARVGALGASAFGYFALRHHVLDGARVGGSEAIHDGLLALPVLLVDAAKSTLAPSAPYLRSLRDEYLSLPGWAFVASGLLCGAIAVGAMVLAWWSRRRTGLVPSIVAALAWFVGPLVPVSIIATVLWPGFGRYLYLAMPGAVWLLALGVQALRARWPEGWRMLSLILVGYVAMLALRTMIFTAELGDERTLYARAIEARPAVAMGYGWLGMSELRAGDAAAAAPLLLRAAALDPTTHRYFVKLGQAYLELQEPALAAAVASLGIERFRDRPEEASYHVLAVRSLTRAAPFAAAEHLVRCLELWPGRPDCVDGIRSLRRDPTHDAALRRAAHGRVDLSALVPSVR